MMGSLMADLENNLTSLNKWMIKNNKPAWSIDEILVALFDEVEYIWPKLGYPPLVTPYSQYVKNVALFNVVQMAKGKERFSMIDDNTWDMLLGKQGKVPGVLAPEIIELAMKQNREFFKGNPQDLYPDNLDEFRKEMNDNNWEFGEDDEELFELAMHPAQYRNYKSGKAKEDFEADLAERKAAKEAKPAAAPSKAPAGADYAPKSLTLDINGERYKVGISYDEADAGGAADNVNQDDKKEDSLVSGDFEEITAPLEGNFYRTKSTSETEVKVGDIIKEGDVIGYIESMKVYNAIASDKQGKVLEVCFKDGDTVEEDDVLIRIG